MPRYAETLLTAAVLAVLSAPASGQSFDCAMSGGLNPVEQRICDSRWLGALDKRLASWYARALERAQYNEVTDALRTAQRDWLTSRDACGSDFWCIRSHYARRIRQLKDYAATA